MSYRIEPLNRLACPRGRIPSCELTGEPASVQLVTEHITLFYATREHAQAAWDGIVKKIAVLLGPLRAPPEILGSEEERQKRDYTLHMSKRALIDLCQQEASKFLVAGRGDLAIPGAVQALAFCKDVHGEGAIEMVPPYLLLAEANLDVGRLHQAEEFLSLANWAVLKNPDCSNAIRSQLHRDSGKLYSAQQRFGDAIRELSRDVYHSSLEVGPEHIDTAGGYFHMANAFYGQQRVEGALALFDKVVEIWYKFLASVRSEPAGAESSGEAQLKEGLGMLQRILDMRSQLLGRDHIATGEASYTVGLLQIFMGRYEDAQATVRSAMDVYRQHLGAEHASTRDVAEVLQQLQRRIGAFTASDLPPASRAAESEDAARGAPVS